MSSITSLISAGGGGGETHIVTDPNKLTRTAISRAIIKNGTGSTNATNQSAFYTNVAATTNMAAIAQTASNNTYVTLLNVSNSDGGYLHWVLSPGVSTANHIITVRIVVDGGAAVELQYQPPALIGGINRMFLGGGIQVATVSQASTATNLENFWNPSQANLTGGSVFKNAEDVTNNVYMNSAGTEGAFVYIQSDLDVLRGMPYQRLYFASSLNVQVKQSTFNSTFENHRAMCLYSLI
jgi:hypothetical protein